MPFTCTVFWNGSVRRIIQLVVCVDDRGNSKNKLIDCTLFLFTHLGQNFDGNTAIDKLRPSTFMRKLLLEVEDERVVYRSFRRVRWYCIGFVARHCVLFSWPSLGEACGDAGFSKLKSRNSTDFLNSLSFFRSFLNTSSNPACSASLSNPRVYWYLVLTWAQVQALHFAPTWWRSVSSVLPNFGPKICRRIEQVTH